MDWQLTCRVCLESGDMVSIFDWDENNEQLCDKYTFCCGIEVSKNDSLPTLICLNCVDKLTYTYQFKQQCLTSNDTLKECLQEFRKSSAAASSSKSKALETETITIKQENGLLLQYELPVEHEPQVIYSREPHNRPVTSKSVIKKRGRPKKYVNDDEDIGVSLYQRKKSKNRKESEDYTSVTSDRLELKEEPVDDEEPFGGDFADNDPDFEPVGDEDADELTKIKVEPKKRGRPRKLGKKSSKSKSFKSSKEDDGEDVLLKETILAFSEPIPDHILNPKKPKKKSIPKKKYVYEKTHTCETCGASFTSNSSLQTHIRRHLGIKPFVCSVCGFASVMKEALKRHMLRHTGERPYKCRICERRFGDYGTRQKHERLHMGIRPYQCSLCGKAFTYSYVLANHMLTHTGEKKYACGPCNKKFTKAHHLKYHNKVHHKELYLQQQLQLEAKRAKEQMTKLSNVSLTTVVDGSLQLIHEDGEQEAEMDVIEEVEDDKETNRAVAGMQGVVLDSDFCIEQDEK